MTQWLSNGLTLNSVGRISAAALVLILSLANETTSLAEQTLPEENRSVLLKADTLTHDDNTGVVTATGDVELSQGERILLADIVSYDQGNDLVIASGNVSLLEPSGDVLFSNYIQLQDELKTGFIQNIKVLMNDGSRLAASSAERTLDRRKIMRHGVFSPCSLCPDDPERDPLWQIKARKVIHHEDRQDIEYQNAVLEMFGFPVLYTPYFVHPDPRVERRSGLLSPTIGHSDELGFIYGQPFFYVVNKERDIEVEPILYSRQGSIIRSRYRQAFANGEIDLKATGGALREPNDQADAGLQGSVDLTGRFSLDDTWRTGFDFEQASQRTYLRRFRLENEEVLTSRLSLEGFRSRNHAVIDSYKFQGLRAGDDRGRQPTILPSVHYHFVGEPDPHGGQLSLDASAMSLTREIGTDSRKLSFLGGWTLPYTAPSGEIYTLNTTLQTDFYSANNPTGAATGPASTDKEISTRIFPQIGLNWRYPLVRSIGDSGQLIEPIINVVVGPNGGNSLEIPNEDSQAFEFDDTNIFELNRFEGSDRVTSGGRIDYGVKFALFETRFGTSQAFLAQSYQFLGQSAFDQGSGLDEDFSDYVGRVLLEPTDWFDLLYRFRVDKDSFRPRRSELGVRIQQAYFSVLLDYVLLDEQLSTTNFGNREQLDFNLGLRISKNWSASTRLVQDLSNDTNRTRIAVLGLAYSDKCFSIGIKYERRDLRDAEIKPEDRVTLRVNFKHLGSVGNFY